MTDPNAAPTPRLLPSPALVDRPLIAVLRASEAADYDAVVDVLVECGVHSIEVTLSTPGTIEHLPHLISLIDRTADLGVGTVTTTEQAQAAIGAGAAYIVTPVMRPEVITACVDASVPVYPGALTPTEVLAAWDAGATAVKIFPAATVGAEYGAHLRGPFPDLKFIPSGGVDLKGIEEWLRAGAVAVSVGGPLLGDALRGGSLADLRVRTRDVVQLVDALRAEVIA